MNSGQIKLEANKLLHQYRDVLSLDKSREMLIKKYGKDQSYLIRQQFAQYWLEQHGMNNDKLKKADNPAVKKRSVAKILLIRSQGVNNDTTELLQQGMQGLFLLLLGRRRSCLSDKIKDESIYTHMSLHTLRG